MRKVIVFSKNNSVLLLLLLTLCSCVVSFGMYVDALYENDELHPKNINNMDIIKEKIKKCHSKPSPCKLLLFAFAPGLITGIGGYDNTWKPLK